MRPAPSTEDSERACRFRVAVQKTRLYAYVLACSVGAVFVGLGVLHISYLDVLLLAGAACLSALVFWAAIHTGLADRLDRLYDPAWLFCDALLITWAVYYSDGTHSPWFPWYLANIAGAAFVLGQGGAFAVFLVDTALYLGLLAAMGDIRGLDLSLYEPLGRMAFLYGASFLFLRGSRCSSSARR